MSFTHILLWTYLCLNLFQAKDAPRFAERLSPVALQEDFQMFKDRLERYHPGLYSYATKAQIDSAFSAIESHLNQPMDELAFYRLLSPLKSLIKDGHTYYYPNRASETVQRLNALPFNVYWDGKSLWVREVKYDGIDLRAGDEILAINDIQSPKLVSQLLVNIIRDGENKSYPEWILNQWFGQIFQYHFAIPDPLQLKIRGENGRVQKIILSKNETELEPLIEEEPKGIVLKYDGEVAVLKVASFNNRLLKDFYKQSFRPEIDKAFEDIASKAVSNLILDLRDNQGGEINNGRYLLSYLLEERFCLVQALKKVSNRSKLSDASRLKEKRIANKRWTQPKSNRFAGKLIVLMNGGSFSCSGAVLAQLEAVDRAVFVGEAAAGNKRVFCGVGPTEYLPNSGISLAVPRVQFRVVNDEQNPRHGVWPDHEIKAKINDIIEGRDVVLKKAISLLL